jgi:hypothetical protein
MNRYPIGQAGVTLVEITIVLVIIGLMLGGLLWGRELLLNGRSKAVISELNEVSAAVALYRDRYNAVPGDDPLAQGRWDWAAVLAATPSSPGDRRVDGAYNAPSAVPEPESRLFWWHLRRGGYIAGTADHAFPADAAQQPRNALGGITGVTIGVGASTVGLSHLILCTANVPGRVAIATDLAVDDGAAADGGLRAHRQTSPDGDIGAAAPNYVEDGGIYLLCRPLS